MSPIRGAVLTVSDRAHSGAYADRSGPLAVALLTEHGINSTLAVVPDEADDVRQGIAAAIGQGARFVLTTGGTGIGPRDVTAQVTATLLDAELPGVIEEIRRRGATKVPTALLSRALAGIVRLRGHEAAFIVNAPGSTGGVRDTIAVAGPLVAHVLDQLAGGDHA